MAYIRSKERKEDCCGNYLQYQLSTWKKENWLCADCFLNELMRRKKYRVRTIVNNAQNVMTGKKEVNKWHTKIT